ncbi:TonB-dependent receptor [Nitrogeniibacter mangrovi]|uniref:TonB-dependent receptor n=1 Tax=Nitrogeniibacter mangrovi TaxID=2016596 RepID=A0A6C1B1W3_9RHOO|nr:TonB-dependent receptor [Nitrogeniibacter mangrovi]QID16330.1 TonB-dependent receptor [Nitrogeniibacter mangrovi]
MPSKPLVLASVIAALPVAANADDTPLPTVTVQDRAEHGTPLGTDTLQRLAPATSDTASLLRQVPGMSVNPAGGVSGLPAIHGLADDRLRIKVDGMDLIAACPNHMNSPLSYLDPSAVGALHIYAGITPVSVGGDSIGGTIVAESAAPVFAAPGQGHVFTGEAGAHYRSNGDASGAHLKATYATETFSIHYADAIATANNTRAARDFKTSTATGRADHTLDRDEVGSTAYKTRNQSVGLAWHTDDHLLDARVARQHVPYELYPNQRMDMLDNDATRINLRYLGQFGWGLLEARAYHEKVEHDMNFGDDKQRVYGTAVNGMPMNTEGETTGASLKATLDLSDREVLRLGGEFQHYTLDDEWPPSGTGTMAPGTFVNINDGRRDRLAAFAEWEARLAPPLTTLLGVRYERVRMDAGDVSGYAPTNGMGMMLNYQLRDATAFNARDHARTDHNWDVTALARYTVGPTLDIEAGIARKVRSPNLYERYTWSTWPMAAVMNNFVGDGNGYVGDVNLAPEKAITVSATFDWHAEDRAWMLKATPFFTRVHDYIDANQPATTPTAGEFVVLKYANQDARLYGLDLSGRMPLGESGLGAWGLEGLLGYTRGRNLDTGEGLYNVMPLNATLTLTHRLGGWDNRAELVMVRGKHHVSGTRNEIETAGYALVNLRGSYAWQQVRLDFGVDNLFDTFHDLPTGGAYTGQGATMGINAIPWGIAVPGPGRSLYAGITVTF